MTDTIWPNSQWLAHFHALKFLWLSYDSYEYDYILNGRILYVLFAALFSASPPSAGIFVRIFSCM
jgi:hypothetical protein